MPDWDDTDTIAEIERDTGEHVIHVDLGKRARIRYWARRRIRQARVVEPDEALTGVMPATDWAAL